MKRTELLQEIRNMRFEEVYEGWNGGRLTQAEAAQILGMCERSFRRYLARYEADGLEGLIDRRLEQLVPAIRGHAKLHLGQKASARRKAGPEVREARCTS